MKKILFIFILLIPFIVYAEYDESKITIESFGMSSHEGHGTENATAVINGKNVNFNCEVSDVGDKITFNMVIKNESGEDIEVYNRLDNSNYIDYMLISPDLDYVVKNNSTKTFQLVVEYVNQVSEEALASGSIRDDKTYTLEVSNEIGRNADALGIDDVTHDAVDPTPTSVPATVDNPNTKAVKNILSIVCIIFVISIGLFLILRKKNRIGKLFVIVGLIGIITPIVVYAYREFNISLKASVIIKKPSSTVEIPVEQICKRVKTTAELHTEICKYENSSLRCAAEEGTGNTITYGTIWDGTGEIPTGAAFDCDVTGDGNFNERFYYVGEYYDTDTASFDNKTAVLMYYAFYQNNQIGIGNVNYAKQEDVEALGYTASGNSINYYGPITAVQNMPKDKTNGGTWRSDLLKKKQRKITGCSNASCENALASNDGGTFPGNGNVPKFDYSGYAGRLLSIYEINKACYDGTTAVNSKGGVSNKCKFIFEGGGYAKMTTAHTAAGVWLENPYSTTTYVWGVKDNNRNLITEFTIACYLGVKPVIDLDIKSITQ